MKRYTEVKWLETRSARLVCGIFDILCSSHLSEDLQLEPWITVNKASQTAVTLGRFN